MKKNYVTGIFTGLLGSLLLIAVMGAVLIFTDLEPTRTTKAKEEISSQSLSSDNYWEIINKLSDLNDWVDKLYLGDTEDVPFADGIYKGFISSLKDPYSAYYTEKEYTALNESTSGVYSGIGASVSQDVKTGIITIVKPFAGGPAHKAGILPGDILSKVEGEEVTGIDLTEVVVKLKGKAGTKVKVTMLREGESKPLNFTLTRKTIEIPTIEYQMLPGKIGYIVISEFDMITVTQFDAAVDALEAKGMKGLIVDVRNNPGGRLDSVVNILDRLLPKGLLVYTMDKNNIREEEFAEDNIKIKVPMAVLINGNSASASEIFAGALQDYKTATVVGTTSFGKGIVQRIIPLKDGRTAVKLTVSKYYTPDGRDIHGKGITPDVKVELNEGLEKMVTIPADKDNQLQRAIKELKKKMK